MNDYDFSKANREYEALQDAEYDRRLAEAEQRHCTAIENLLAELRKQPSKDLEWGNEN